MDSYFPKLESHPLLNRVPLRYDIEYHYRPGLYWSNEQIASETEEFRNITRESFGGRDVPLYQCLLGTRESYSDKIIVLARARNDGQIIGFTSAVLFHVPTLEDPVVHSGLTCIHPRATKLGLVRKLMQTLLVRYLLFRPRPWRRVYITNLSSVVSLLGAFATKVDNVFPAPNWPSPNPSNRHLLIARQFAKHVHEITTLNPDAQFNEDSFVFEGANRSTVFSKIKGANRYRDLMFDDYFTQSLDFDNGDAMLQVGSVSLFYFFILRPIYMFLSRLFSTHDEPHHHPPETPAILTPAIETPPSLD